MANNSKMYLYGAGGHSKVVAEILATHDVEVVTVFDDDETKVDLRDSGIKVRGQLFPKLEHPVIVAIGDNAARSEIVRLLDAQFGIGIHRSAIISPSAQLGEGTVILQGAIVQANAVIGKHVLINTGASVDHDNVIGDFAHLSPQAAICGHVEIGEGTHIGAAATVIPSVKIGKWCTIGAGSVVINDIPDFCTAVGNPARIIKQHCPHPLETQSETESQMFDIAMIGSGLSSTMTIINFLKNLTASPPARPIKIALCEKKDFFGGLAYGSRAEKSALVITNLEEFLPQPEREEFKSWLCQNKSWLLDLLSNRAGRACSEWLQRNTQAVLDGQWERLFIPRFIFGVYLQTLAQQHLDRAAEQKLVECQTIHGEAEDIERDEDNYCISINHSCRPARTIYAEKVVLSIGSPPFRKIFDEAIYGPKLGGLLINEPYRINLGETLSSIARLRKKRDDDTANVLIIGSNASTIETIYNLYYADAIQGRLGKIFVLSTSGEFPSRITDCNSSQSFEAPNLDGLKQVSHPTARQIFEAAKADIQLARQSPRSSGDTFFSISGRVNEMVKRLDAHEKRQFVNTYGVEIGRYQRRAGGEYSDVVDTLKAAGKLVFLRGRFQRVATQDETGLTFDYLDSDGELVRFQTPIQIAINCAGFEPVSAKSSSKLIRRLLGRGLCRANDSELGIQVDDQLAAGPDLYVIGPLLGGNIVGDVMVWHAEHCGRIIGFSKQLAQTLADSVAIEEATVQPS